MFKNWSKSEIIALCYLGAAVFGVYVYGVFDDHAYNAEAYEQSHPGQGWQYWGDVSNRSQAWTTVVFGAITAAFTYMLYMVSASQRELLANANKTAIDALKASENALAETRRSVDAYIAAERGYLRMRDVSSDQIQSYFSNGQPYAFLVIIGYETIHGQRRRFASVAVRRSGIERMEVLAAGSNPFDEAEPE